MCVPVLDITVWQFNCESPGQSALESGTNPTKASVRVFGSWRTAQAAVESAPYGEVGLLVVAVLWLYAMFKGTHTHTLSKTLNRGISSNCLTSQSCLKEMYT